MFVRILGIVAVFLTGLLAWVVPPHTLGMADDSYYYTVWPWLGEGLWNMMPLVSVPLTMVIGVAYGMFEPKYWYVAFFGTCWVVPLNVALDTTIHPTSHNLLGIEFMIFAVLNVPTLFAARLGSHIGLKYLKRES